MSSTLYYLYVKFEKEGSREKFWRQVGSHPTLEQAKHRIKVSWKDYPCRVYVSQDDDSTPVFESFGEGKGKR